MLLLAYSIPDYSPVLDIVRVDVYDVARLRRRGGNYYVGVVGVVWFRSMRTVSDGGGICYGNSLP